MPNVPRGSRFRLDLANLDLDEVVRLELLVKALPPDAVLCRVRRRRDADPDPRPGGRVPFRLDMGWRKRRKAVEHDGVEGHDGAAERRADEERRACIRSVGWDVLVVGKGEVLGRSQDVERAVGELLGLPFEGRPRQW